MKRFKSFLFKLVMVLIVVVWNILNIFAMTFIMIFRVLRIVFIDPFRRLMLRAIKTNNLGRLHWLLNLGFSPNFSLNDENPLRLAVAARNEAVIHLLRAYRADLNQVFSLTKVIASDDLDLARYLLKLGIQNEVGALALAVKKGDYDLVEQLLAHGSDPNDKKEVDSYFYVKHPGLPSDIFRASPLFIALCRRNDPLVKLLLAHGADPDQRVEALEEFDDTVCATVSIREMALLLGDNNELRQFPARVGPTNSEKYSEL